MTWIDSERACELRRARFVTWLAADPLHRTAFVSMNRAWRRTGMLVRLRQTELMRANPVSVAGRRPLWGVASWPRLRALALTPVCVAGMFLLVRLWMFPQPQWNTYKTGRGALQSVSLADGSLVTLNTDSELLVQVSHGNRTVRLVRGEARFEVTRDQRHPFALAAGNVVVRDVGTAFVVRIHNDEDVEVLVQEGQVAVDRAVGSAGGKPEFAVTAGFVLEMKSDAQTLHALSKDELSRRLAWMHGRIEFGGESLAAGVAEFNRYNRVQLAIAAPDIEPVKLGGGFEATNPQSFVRALEQTYDLEVAPAADGSEVIRLRKRRP